MRGVLLPLWGVGLAGSGPGPSSGLAGGAVLERSAWRRSIDREWEDARR